MHPVCGWSELARHVEQDHVAARGSAWQRTQGYETGCRSFALYAFHAPTNIMCTQPVGGPAASIRRRSRRCRSSGGKRSGAGCGDHITIRWWRHRTNDTPPFHLRWKRDDSRTPGYARVGTALRLTCKGGVWAIRRTSRPPIPACSRWRLDRRRPGSSNCKGTLIFQTLFRSGSPGLPRRRRLSGPTALR